MVSSLVAAALGVGRGHGEQQARLYERVVFAWSLQPFRPKALVDDGPGESGLLGWLAPQCCGAARYLDARGLLRDALGVPPVRAARDLPVHKLEEPQNDARPISAVDCDFLAHR